MPRRELFAAAALPVVLAVIVWAPAWVFLAVVAAAATVAGDELLRMARGAGIRSGRWLPLVALPGVAAASWSWGAAGAGAASIAVIIALPTVQLASPSRPEGSLAGASVGAFAALYLGLGAASLGWLRLLPDASSGVRLILLYLFCIWVGDSGAYYVGSTVGRHRMTPRISPNKTWEGLAGGVLATFVAAAILRPLLGLELPWPHTLGVAAILAVTAPLGDLVESQFKRDTRVKDSSSLIPGHGGFLDRTDSLLYSAPPVLGYLVLVGQLP